MAKIFTALWMVLMMAPLATASTLADIPFNKPDGSSSTLKDYQGKVVLIVNVASKCGLTKQYAALQGLYDKYQSQGFEIIAFPCNDFGGQEPGTNEEIQAFCTEKFNVTFPLMDKIHVKGENQHPLYQELTGPEAKFPGLVKWNFGKFLVSKDGEVIARFEPRTTPDDPSVIKAIEEAL